MTKSKSTKTAVVVENTPTTFIETLKADGLEFEEFTIQYQSFAPEEREQLPAITINNGIAKIRKSSASGTLRVTEFHKQVLNYLEQQTGFVKLLDIAHAVERDPYPVRSTVKSLKNENRPIEERVSVHVKLHSGGKVEWLYCLASRFDEYILAENGLGMKKLVKLNS